MSSRSGEISRRAATPIYLTVDRHPRECSEMQSSHRALIVKSRIDRAFAPAPVPLEVRSARPQTLEADGGLSFPLEPPPPGCLEG